jgi:hypothetical protein
MRRMRMEMGRRMVERVILAATAFVGRVWVRT